MPSLFGEDKFTNYDHQLHFINLSIKQAGMAIPNSASQAQKNYNDNIVSSTHLVLAHQGKEEFNYTEDNIFQA